MPELVVLTTGSPRAAEKNIASRAATNFEQYAQKHASPYWNVTVATKTIDTVAKATGEVTVDSGSESKTPLVFESGYPKARALLDEAFSETVSEAQAAVTDFRDGIAEVVDETPYNTEETDVATLLDALADDEDAAQELLSTDDFLDAASAFGQRFGRVYRVFDLTDHRHGYPVRSFNNYEETKAKFANRSETLYVVKLLAREQ